MYSFKAPRVVWIVVICCLLFMTQSTVLGQVVLKKRSGLAGTVEDYLNTKDWSWSENKSDNADKSIFWVKFKGENISFKSYFVTDEKLKFFRILSFADFKVPENKRSEAAEYLMRVNCVRSIGSFDIDFNDGEVKYKIGVDVEGGELVHKMIQNMTVDCHAAMDKYIPGLLKVIYGDVSPEKILDEILED